MWYNNSGFISEMPIIDMLLVWPLMSEFSKSFKEEANMIAIISGISIIFFWWNEVSFITSQVPLRCGIRILVCWLCNIDKRKKFLEHDSLKRSIVQIYYNMYDIPEAMLIFEPSNLQILLWNSKSEKILEGKIDGYRAGTIDQMFPKSSMTELEKQIDTILKSKQETLTKELELDVMIGNDDNHI